MVKDQTSSTAARRPLIDHIDISKPEAIAKVKEIFDEYTNGENATFDSQTTVHIGADEFLANYTAYRNFINDFVPHVKQTNPVRMWGGLTWIKDNPETQINKDAIENVELLEDVTLGKNECMIETGNGVFDCSLGTQLEALNEELRLLSYEP